jgi:hypothetical protein
VYTTEGLYEQAPKRFQVTGEFTLKHRGTEVRELEDNMTVEMTGTLQGGDPTMVRFRIECGTREWGEQLIPGESVGEWRRRAMTLLNAREQEHAQCVCIDEALLDEEDAMADWVHPKVVVTLQREQEQDKTWKDDAEEVVQPGRGAWPPMTQEEINESLRKFVNEDQHSDDEMIRRRADKPTGKRKQEIQQYRCEAEKRTRWEPIKRGDTVESWLARISRKMGERWQGVWHKGMRIPNTDQMELHRPG